MPVLVMIKQFTKSEDPSFTYSTNTKAELKFQTVMVWGG